MFFRDTNIIIIDDDDNNNKNNSRSLSTALMPGGD